MRLAHVVLGALLGAERGARAMRTWQPIRELRKQIIAPDGEADGDDGRVRRRDVDPALFYPAHNLSVPVDHFHNDSAYEPHTDELFDLRYWFDASHYEPGGPVIVLAAGETSGAGRLPFLQKGILARLAAATRGVGVVLEHRYYGTSFPVANLSTASLRFLTTDQAMADTAYFARHVRFPGLPDEVSMSLDPSATPWIVYGGSYAGAFAAFLRKLYPDVFWGAISSSGVTEAIHDYWQYYEAQRLFAPAACVAATQKMIHAADNILLGNVSDIERHAYYVSELKTGFGLGGVTRDADFAALLSDAMTGWQARNWDPAQSEPDFDRYCANVTAPTLLYPALEPRRAAVRLLLEAGGYGGDEGAALETPMLNYVGWVNATHRCGGGKTQDECFANGNETFYRQDDISQRWRAWPYQYCTQWGYLTTGSGAPTTQLPLVSRLMTLPYLSTVCAAAFNITTPPDTNAINRHGGFDIRYPRLAFVDGEADPWRGATPHSAFTADGTTPRAADKQNRTSTAREPFLLIGGGAVHHWDENGLFANETTAEMPPAPVRDAQAREVEFVQAWMREWREERGLGQVQRGAQQLLYS